MTSNFDLARSIYLSKEDMVELLGQLKPTKFAFTVLRTLIAVPFNNNTNNNKSSRIGIITGFASLTKNNNNNNLTSLLIESHLRDNNNNNTTLVAEADVALVVDFGDAKETIR